MSTNIQRVLWLLTEISADDIEHEDPEVERTLRAMKAEMVAHPISRDFLIVSLTDAVNELSMRDFQRLKEMFPRDAGESRDKAWTDFMTRLLDKPPDPKEGA
jgi:hypothetical protein